jgi:thiol:disulfide interchange protein DsbD
MSAGSLTKPPRADAGACLVVAFAWTIATLWTGAVSAAGPKLLEPERAFAFSVQALDDKTVEARFAVANGYYLYREKLHFSVEPASLAAAPSLPAGTIKDDEFFGKVETYRGQLAVKLALQQPAPGSKVVVRAESQGCADAGVCYPPQVQTVTVTLPLAGMPPAAPVAATPARKSWFN